MIKSNSPSSFVKTFPSQGGNVDETHWVPNTDVWIAETGLVIKVELAGMQREDLELTVEGNKLRIHGQRVDGCRCGKCKFILMEINYGAFETVIDIPPGFDLTKAKAVYQNGFLRVDIPHIDPSSSRKIPINNGE